MTAKMYPERLPTNVKSPAERKLFDLMRDNLPDEYTVIWSIAWNILRDPTRGGGAQDGEVDFLLLHPQHGLLNLEIKGGGVGYDATEGYWYSIDRFGNRHKLHNPFEQATECMHVLHRELTQNVANLQLRHACVSGNFARAVVFPDIDASGLRQRPISQDRWILDRHDVQPANLVRAIENIYRYFWRNYHRPLGTTMVQEIIKIYAPTIFVRPPLINEFEADEAKIHELTEQQIQSMHLLNGQLRFAIAGCAGSGKTFLAIEQARHLARRGLKVLFTCYNRNLAEWVRHSLSEEARATGDEALVDNIAAYNFHKVARDICKQAGIALATQADNESRSFDEEWANKLLEASAQVTTRYDVVIADEGQDFNDSWWIALLSLLRDQTQNRFYIFYDNNQRIYKRNSDYPVPAEQRFTLNVNCRTTKTIHDEMIKFYAADEKPDHKGQPPGRKVEQIGLAQPELEMPRLRELLNQLTSRTGEDIPLEDIVLLTPAGKATTRFRDGLKIGSNFQLAWNVGSPPTSRTLTCSSIFAFKGLERKVVILAELDRLTDMPGESEREQLIYVALSRAKLHLIILGNSPLAQR